MSPKESCGIPAKTEFMPTNKLGREEAKAMTKKAITNSLNLKNLAIFISDPTRKEPERNIKHTENMKISA
jgi:hypothetical protein